MCLLLRCIITQQILNFRHSLSFYIVLVHCDLYYNSANPEFQAFIDIVLVHCDFKTNSSDSNFKVSEDSFSLCGLRIQLKQTYIL